MEDETTLEDVSGWLARIFLILVVIALLLGLGLIV